MDELLERRELALEDGAISYLVGEIKPGRPSFHLLHATGFNAQTYRQILEPLTEYVNVYASDLRGHGLGSLDANPERLDSWDVYRRDFFQLLDFIDEPIYLMGHSVGSVVSIAGALHRPDIVKGLILTEPLIYPENMMQMFDQSDPNMNPMVMGALKRRATFDSEDAMVQNYLDRGAFKTWGESWIRDYVKGGSIANNEGGVKLSCQPEWEAKSFQVAEDTPWDDIKQLSCPTSIVYAKGAGFSTCHEVGVDKYLSLQPDTTVTVDTEASHFLPMEKSGLVIRAVKEMVSRTA
ncbi:MAG: alpha/beta hydrolase [Gammaproteobacteria bacterium]|nr:alpha/beta hydrolase [Gammaproteobacteria bacterium]